MADHPGPDPATPTLVGREREQATLREHLDAALAGRGALVLIGGEAGIGKTALAEALLAEAAAQGALPLVGRCYDLTETPPYGPWAEALATAPIAPDHLAPPHFAGTGSGAGVPTSQATLFVAVRDYLAALATHRPIILLLDDLHWADPATLDLLRTLARGLADTPLLLLATYRANELTRRHPLYTLLPTLVRETRAPRLDLRPLDEAELRSLVRAHHALEVADEARLVGHLAAHAEGNPFYSGELLRTLEGEGVLRRANGAWSLGNLAQVRVPPLLRQLIDARVDRLGEATRTLLAVAATIGQAVPLDLWQGMSDGDEDALLAAIEAATEARLLTVAEDGRSARFAHALIREALYEGILPIRRRSWHRRIGEALAARADVDTDAVAYHFRQAGDERAGAWLVRAGERAERAYAWISAAARVEAALTLLEERGAGAGERGWLALRLARLNRYADGQRALGRAEAAARLAGEAADPLLAALATYLAGMVRCHLGELRRGISQMEAGLAALDALPESERLPPGATVPLDPALRRGTVVCWLAPVGRYAEARTSGEHVLADVAAPPAADWLGDSPYADALNGLGVACEGLGLPDRARAAFARSSELNRAVGHYQQVGVNAESELVVVLQYQTDRQADLQQLADEKELAFTRAGGVLHLPPRIAQLPLLMLNGQWDEARRLATAVHGLPIGVGPRLLTESRLGQLARAQGDADLAWGLVREWLPAGPATNPGDAWFAHAQVFQRLAADLALDAGDLPTACAWLAAHDRWLAWSGAVPGRSEGQRLWAAYHRAGDNPIAARASAEQALAHATAPRQPLALLAAHRTLGELATDASQHADAARHLDTALALAVACAAPYERALTLLALAELHAAGARPEEVAAALAEARAILIDLGATPALARAGALAARLDAPGPAVADALPFGLTAREAEVLRLVAEGLPDLQVAARLFVSRNTVSTHLKAVYGKLGVTTRAAATRLALEHGLG